MATASSKLNRLQRLLSTSEFPSKETITPKLAPQHVSKNAETFEVGDDGPKIDKPSFLPAALSNTDSSCAPVHHPAPNEQYPDDDGEPSNPIVLEARFGEVAAISATFAPIIAVSKLPYKFVSKQWSQRIAEKFFDRGKFWDRKWTLYFVNPNPSYGKPLIFIPISELVQLLDEVNTSFPAVDLRSPPELILDFPFTHPALRPRFLGCSSSKAELTELEMATSTASDLWEVPAANGASSRPLVPDDRSLASFKARVEATIELGKNKSKANRVKKNEERIAKQQDVAKMLKRGQRYLGLRARSSSAELHEALFLLQLDHSSPSILPPDWDANHPSPHAFEHEPIIISIDIEAYEKPPRPITEIGISTLDTRDLIGVAPGNNCEAWFALVRTRHFRIAEHAHLRNGDFVAGCPDKYEFGKSEFIAQRDAPSKIAECFRPPYSCDVAPSTREVRSAKLEAGTPVKSQDRKTAPSEQPERRRVILLGHDVGQDISYLRSMGYNPLNLDNLLELLDTASMFRAMAREPSPRSLTHILYTFGIVGWNLHNAGNDAAYTMHAFLGIALRSALDDRREAIEANAPKNSSVDEDTIKTQTLKEEREEAVRVKAEQAAREAAERVHELAQGWTDGPGERDNDGGVAVPPTLTDVPAPSDVTSAGRGGRGGRGGSGLRGGRGTDGHGGNSGGNRGGGSNGTGMNRGSSWW